MIDPPHALIFLGADLTRCRFLGTDLRGVMLVGVIWPRIHGVFDISRNVTYDEIAPQENPNLFYWSMTEQIYRGLKQNYQEQCDYHRAGDFRYSEKEMLRRNPETPPILRFLLTLYWLVSGYGQRYIRPLFWAVTLLVFSTFGYLILGIIPQGGEAALKVDNFSDWLRAGLYSFQVMILLKPTTHWVLTQGSEALRTLQTMLGPLFLIFFIITVRRELRS